jgi:hypothetical protein
MQIFWSNTRSPAETKDIYESDFDAGLKERVTGEEMWFSTAETFISLCLIGNKR